MEKEQVQKIAETQDNETTEKYKLLRVSNNSILCVPDVEVTRSEYEIKSEKYYQYKLALEIYGKKQEINRMAGTFKTSDNKNLRDKDIYEMLDFAFSMFADVHFGIKSERNGVTGKYENTFFVVGINSDGVETYVPVRITRMSSLSVLATFLSIVSKKYDVNMPSLF